MAIEIMLSPGCGDHSMTHTEKLRTYLGGPGGQVPTSNLCWISFIYLYIYIYIILCMYVCIYIYMYNHKNHYKNNNNKYIYIYITFIWCYLLMEYLSAFLDDFGPWSASDFCRTKGSEARRNLSRRSCKDSWRSDPHSGWLYYMLCK